MSSGRILVIDDEPPPNIEYGKIGKKHRARSGLPEIDPSKLPIPSKQIQLSTQES